MANLTLTIDDDVLRRARIRALEHGTSVNALVRDYLVGLVGSEDRIMDDLLDALDQTDAGSGGRTWTRDELHAR